MPAGLKFALDCDPGQSKKTLDREYKSLFILH